MVAQRPVPGIFLDTPLRPRRSGRAGYLHHGCGQQAVGAVDARWRAKRLPIGVAGQPAYCFSIQSFRLAANLDHVGRRQQPESADLFWEQFRAELEWEIDLFLSLDISS